MNKIAATFKSLVAIALLACAGSALAQSSVQIQWDTAIYSGPGETYPAVGYVESGRNVSLYGCLNDYAWCEVSNGYDRGWIDADALGVYRNNQVYNLYSSRSWYTYPIVSFIFTDYWRSHYYNRPWYHDRSRYSNWNWRNDDYRWGNRPNHNGRPDYGRPGYGRPGYGYPNNRPGNSNRPDDGRPGYNRPNTGRPNYGNGNNSGRPGYGRPDNNRPDTGRPNYGNGSNNGRPGYNRPDVNTPTQRPVAVPGSRPMTRPNTERPNPSVQPPRERPQPQVSQPRPRSDQPSRSTPSQRPSRSDGNLRQQTP